MHVLISLVLAALLVGCAASPKWPELSEPDLAALESHDWPDPARYEEAISEFEKSDRSQMPPEGAILAIGSSSMRGWHGNIHKDLQPLTIIPRGFGGSNMYDVYSFADRIVLPYKPRAIMIYEGDNDIALGAPPEAVMQAYRAIKYHVHSADPSVRFYLLAVKPSPSRWDVWPQMQEVNRLFQQEAESDPRVTYIDIATPMLGLDGMPKPEIFLDDDLHMNRKGYELWRDAVRPILILGEADREKE